jgi:putative transposase
MAQRPTAQVNRLREELRKAEGRHRNPSTAVIDSQVVKTTRVCDPKRGYDGAKRLSRRKRHMLVNMNELVLAARLHSAYLPPTVMAGGDCLLGEELGLPRLELVWTDGAYTRGFREWAEQERGWQVEAPHHRNGQLWR